MQNSKSHGGQCVPLHREDYTKLHIEIYIYLYINGYIFIKPLPRTAGLASSVHSSSRGPAGQTQRWSCRRLGRTPPGTGGAERWEETEEQLKDVRGRWGQVETGAALCVSLGCSVSDPWMDYLLNG